jgi:hypothetical protein
LQLRERYRNCPFLKFEHRREGVDISRHVSSARHLLLSAQWSPGLPLPTSTVIDTVDYYGATFAPAPSAHKIIGRRPISALDGHVQSLADVTRRPADFSARPTTSRATFNLTGRAPISSDHAGRYRLGCNHWAYCNAVCLRLVVARLYYCLSLPCLCSVFVLILRCLREGKDYINGGSYT